jgi:hypothetical protein
LSTAGVLRCRVPRGQRGTTGVFYRVQPLWQRLCKPFTKAVETMALLLLREMTSFCILQKFFA